MLTVGSYQEMDQNKYEENWLIVRKPDDLPDFVKHIPALSPSPICSRNIVKHVRKKRLIRNFLMKCMCHSL